jgi:hypothetical protein
MLTQDDRDFIASKGISAEGIDIQLANFSRGFPYLPIVASASVEKGILSIPTEDQSEYIKAWEKYLAQDKEVVKFVPASGAASRMFKDLFAFAAKGDPRPSTAFEQTFFENIQNFAFYPDLDRFCRKNEGRSVEELISDGQLNLVIKNLLSDKGLNYGNLPKGLILFHAASEGARTAMEEHWVEGALYACGRSKIVHLHFTVSPAHRSLFEALIREKTGRYAQTFGVNFRIALSEQKPSTDTLAVDSDNRPLRENGRLVFRPGGHGALIQNLNEIAADVVFIKNIDNVVPDAFKPNTVYNKQLIAGVLVSYQQRIFDYLNLIDSGKYTHEELISILYFLQNQLCIKNPETKHLEDGDLVLYIKSKLNRPLRVCGMVRNAGEPGGGPFLAVNSDGTISPQVVESSQIDLLDPEKLTLFEQSTHFNPVDLVCALKNYKGEKFHLPDYVDNNAGFISLKSKNGKDLKALELPGLWNGAMSDWNTVFVEVPISTFNPVKTVNDLLRPEHQS